MPFGIAYTRRIVFPSDILNSCPDCFSISLLLDFTADKYLFTLRSFSGTITQSTTIFEMASETPTKEPSWHARFPSPRNQNPDSITRDELLAWFSKQPTVKDFVLVDLRRTDYQVRILRLMHIRSMLIELGWHYPWVYKPSGSVVISHNSKLICHLLCGTDRDCGLVLR